MIEALFSGETVLRWWAIAVAAAAIGCGVATGYFAARKIQPRGFKWKALRREIIFGAGTFAISAPVLFFVQDHLVKAGIIAFRREAAPWWLIGLEYALYFFAFDAWFYWLHRWMHKEPVYSWVHKVHHGSTSPNVMTTFSVSPLESLINGGFVPLFLSFVSVHDATMALIGSTNLIMGVYVHMGYEFLPKWWNKTWVTKWFITATFHDQHHRYFTCNYGGYTSLWDRICGTVRPKYEADFDKLKDRASRVAAPEMASTA
jgi:sterol desaturase/sphingolipid hydroxylase (fatty acid hydroxylase superfamily)